MCLSTVYANEMNDDRAIMNNVMLIECEGRSITLIDLMGRRQTVEGEILKASLTDGYVILRTE